MVQEQIDTRSSVTTVPNLEHYDDNVLMPPGIQNAGNFCFASSIFQYLVNHPTFVDSEVARTVLAHHKDGECSLCKDSSTDRYDYVAIDVQVDNHHSLCMSLT